MSAPSTSRAVLAAAVSAGAASLVIAVAAASPAFGSAAPPPARSAVPAASATSFPAGATVRGLTAPLGSTKGSVRDVARLPEVRDRVD